MAAAIGNQYGRRAKVWTESLKRSLARAEDSDGHWRRGLDKLADKLREAAMNGESWALQHFADRLEGKAAETVRIDQTVHVAVSDEPALSGRLEAKLSSRAATSDTVQ
jgi:hypothetical protein